MVVDEWSKVLRGVGRKGFVCDGGKLETNSALDRKPMQLSKKRLRVGLAVRLEDNSGKRVLNALKFIDNVVGGTEKNRVSVVKTRTDESMGNEWGSLIIEIVPDVAKSLHVVVAELRDLVDVFMEGESFVQSNTKKLYCIS